MEVVGNLEDKWKLSTKQALFLLLFAASAVAMLCVATTTVTLLRRLKSRKASQKQLIAVDNEGWTPDAACGWAAIKTTLMGSLRWSRGSKWGEAGGSSSSSSSSGSSGGSSTWREMPLPLLEKRQRPRVSEYRGHEAATWAAQSHNSESPVWQRPILMGERCELPRFSGLILYDENGQPCDVARRENSYKNVTSSEVKSTAKPKAVRTTLRDLL